MTTPIQLFRIAMLALVLTPAVGIGEINFKKTLQSALAGDPAAQYELGLHYHFGRGVSKDDAEAAKWWR